MYQPNKKRLFQKKKNYIRISTVQNNYSYRCNKPASKLNPLFIPKYENQLFIPPVFEPIVVKGQDEKGQCKTEHLYNIDIGELRQQMLPKGYPKTMVWGYGGMIREPGCSKVRYFRGSPGPTFEAIQGIPVKVKWINKLCGRHPFPVDPTLHWANPNHMPMDPPKPWPMFPPGFREAQKSIPAVTHLHGGEVSSLSDGYPEAWFTYDGQHGPAFTSN
jgi:FtsP/CotA-like multicopper oxidase with cupredoxin domain